MVEPAPGDGPCQMPPPPPKSKMGNRKINYEHSLDGGEWGCKRFGLARGFSRVGEIIELRSRRHGLDLRLTLCVRSGDVIQPLMNQKN
ncbi:hypothetical protein Csa_017900 [Cucumis sativus]|nr:hypothetical protein Csa_017900 [Cucumis sativus]